MLVSIEKLGKRYGSFSALSDCTLSVQQGEVFGLLGPNGAGKTTLLRILLGFLRPSSGTAKIAGYDCERESVEVRKRVAYLPGERTALSASDDGTLRLWDIESGKELHKFEGHAGAIHSLAVSTDGRKALTGGEDGTVRLWDLAR